MTTQSGKLRLLLLFLFQCLPSSKHIVVVVAAAYTPGEFAAWKQRQQKDLPRFHDALKAQEQRSPSSTTIPQNGNLQKETNHDNVESLTMEPIGTVSSVYRLCVGTPRQGLLAPNSRGRIDLHPNRISIDTVMDLDQFSHLWIVFVFHLNSNVQKTGQQTKNDVTSSDKAMKQQQQFPSKIRPPALGGGTSSKQKNRRVGIFATRTPHRPNPIGFTLCKLDKIVRRKKQKHEEPGQWQPLSIEISGLDLVDGTPVLDIKPYVPHYDSIGYNYNNLKIDGTGKETSATTRYDCDMEEESQQPLQLESSKIPNWINDGLTKRRQVSFTPSAERRLKDIVMASDNGSKKGQGLLEFYGKASGRDSTTAEGISSLRSCIQQVLSVDVRSIHQTKKARQGKFKAERTRRVMEQQTTTALPPQSEGVLHDQDKDVDNEEGETICTQQLDRLLVYYSVQETASTTDTFGGDDGVDTFGSGADDIITVIEIQVMEEKK